VYICDSPSIKYMDCSEYHIQGYNFIRLGGLAQFMNYSGSDRSTNLFFEIKTELRPNDEGYPFDLARESVKGDTLNDFIVATVQNHTQNGLTSARVANEDVPNKRREITRGYTLKGTRTKSGDTSIMTSRERQDMPTIGEILAAIQMGGRGETVEVKNDGKGIAMLMYDYRKPEEYAKAEFHAKFLRAWQEVLKLVALEDDAFGIGLTTDRNLVAQRHPYGNITYYLVNPTFYEEITSSDGAVLSLWQTACHEVTHYHFADHNEHFSAMEAEIGRITADVIFVELKRIAKLLR